jgi:DNA-binding NarL/FixJ family response regulator
MTSVFILRRKLLDARHSQAALEATHDLRIAGVSDALFKARMALGASGANVLLTDLRLNDGTVLGLLHELRSAKPAQGRMRVMVVATAADDALLFAALRTGADGYLLEADASSSPAPAIGRLLRGEAAANAAVARQALSFFGVSGAALAAQPANERALDWEMDAHNPLRLSRAEQHMLVLLSQGHGVGQIAVRMGVSVECIGRRIGNVYRKMQWELSSGSLSMQAA